LAALLNTSRTVHWFDLHTVVTVGGQILRWSATDRAVTINGNTWTIGPGLQRSRIAIRRGVQVDEMTVTVQANENTLVNSRPLLPLISRGFLDGARWRVSRAFAASADSAPVGLLTQFAGRVGDVGKLTRSSTQIRVVSDLDLLNTMVPRNLYQPGCLNTLFDAACGLSEAAARVTSTASSASNANRTTFGHSLAQAAGFFDLGWVAFTSGANAGVRRTVRVHTSGQITTTTPWPEAIAPGDAFTIVPGCDKSLATCTSKFNNRIRFRGQPFIPVPEIAT
jgi:uncharacterized phage protein (TIGR02218 family)